MSDGDVPVAPNVLPVIDAGVGLRTNGVFAVEQGESAASAARLRRISLASRAAVALGDLGSGRSKRASAVAFLRVLGSGILLTLVGAEGDARLDSHLLVVGIGGGVNRPPNIGVASYILPRTGEELGDGEFISSVGERKLDVRESANP